MGQAKSKTAQARDHNEQHCEAPVVWKKEEDKIKRCNDEQRAMAGTSGSCQSMGSRIDQAKSEKRCTGWTKPKLTGIDNDSEDVGMIRSDNGR